MPRNQTPAVQPTLTLSWDGTSWTVFCTVPGARLCPGASFSVPLPPDALRREPRPGETRLLFPESTCLYLPLKPVRNAQALAAIVSKHFAALGVRCPDDGKEYVPVRLLDDLRVKRPSGDGVWPTVACRCRIDGLPKTFPTLNALASHALIEWKKSQTGAIDVFHGVVFRHGRAYLPIVHQRALVVDGVALPETPDPGKDTLPLPGILQ